MKLASLRPQTQKGQTVLHPQQVEEEPVRFIAIVTEGSKEELAYLKGYCSHLQQKGWVCKGQILYLNDSIRPDIYNKEIQASHPKRRMELMKELLSQKNPDFLYRPEEAWMVCDRDDGSFHVDQYEEVYEVCQQEGIHWVVSNPAFQLWLLLHYDSWLSDRLFEDGLSSKARVDIIERRLKVLLPAYRHGSLNFSFLASKVERAKENSRRYCTDVEHLKDEVGTNFAPLMDALRQFHTECS